MVNKGAEINQVTNNGNAALHLVSSNGHIDIVKLLVENDAALYQFNNDKLIPWVLALVKGHENIVDYLNELLEHEPEHGELAKCSELVRNNLGINFDDNGATSSGNTENDLYNQD